MPDAPVTPARPVAIAGCGAITAVGSGVDKLGSALRCNLSGLRRLEKFDSPRFRSSLVGAALADPTIADPAYSLATAALREAVAEAQTILGPLPSARIGLVLATTKANINALELLADQLPCPASARRHVRGDLLAADLAAEHGAQGPVLCISTACVSGLIALQQGAAMIQGDRADAVLVVGVDHLSAFIVAGFTALKAIDPNGCRPFDRHRAGLSPGEAGAAIVLVRADLAVPGQSPAAGGARVCGPQQVACNAGRGIDYHATQPPYPLRLTEPPSEAVRESAPIVIRGWGGSNDANHLTGPSRDGSGLAQAVRSALEAAHLAPSDISYINAHGTGTPYNDAMESQALHTVFGSACPPVSAFKGMLGHTLGAAGVVETIGCVLALRARFLPGTPGLQTPDDCAPASLVREPRNVAGLHHVLKLNTGFGGINGALILSHG